MPQSFRPWLTVKPFLSYTITAAVAEAASLQHRQRTQWWGNSSIITVNQHLASCLQETKGGAAQIPVNGWPELHGLKPETEATRQI